MEKALKLRDCALIKNSVLYLVLEKVQQQIVAINMMSKIQFKQSINILVKSNFFESYESYDLLTVDIMNTITIYQFKEAKRFSFLISLQLFFCYKKSKG